MHHTNVVTQNNFSPEVKQNTGSYHMVYIKKKQQIPRQTKFKPIILEASAALGICKVLSLLNRKYLSSCWLH